MENEVKTVPVEEVHKIVSVKFEGQKMIIAVDTNLDGEPSVEVCFNMMETADEVMAKILKK